MSLFSRLFGTKPPLVEAPPIPNIAPPQSRDDVHRGADVAMNSDILTGWRFSATMQLRTPLRVLSRHGEVHNSLAIEPPLIVREQWEGIWLQQTRSFREMGIDLDETAFSMASDIGQVPQDGGEYLPFLVAIRKAAEGEGSAKHRRDATAAILRDPAYGKFVRAHGGQAAILDHLFPRFNASIPRLPAATSKALDKAGFRTPAKIAGASDKDLLGVEGVGPATVKALREAANGAVDQDQRYVDRVTR